MSMPRFSPSFVVAVIALVVASGGAGFAAGQITSAQIQDGTIRSADVQNNALTTNDLRNGTVGGLDVRKRSIPRDRLSRSCAPGEEELFGGCVPRRSFGPTSHQGAIDDCNRRNGRLPTTLEIFWIVNHDEFDWADGNVSNYEFTGDYTDGAVFNPIAFDRAGNAISNASAQLFWHHCVISY